jgi:hypothetical protein
MGAPIRRDLHDPVASEVRFIDVAEAGFLAVDGAGDPNASPGEIPAFQEALEALYAVSYGLRFGLKPEGIEFTVGPLEALWWTVDPDGREVDLAPGAPFDDAAKAGWHWRAMMWQPDAVTLDVVRRFRDEAARKAAKKGRAMPGLDRLRFERWCEGRCAQILHVGPYAAEGPTIARLHDEIEKAGLEPRGHHHEIYLGDPRRSAPERLRTVLRQPVG